MRVMPMLFSGAAGSAEELSSVPCVLEQFLAGAGNSRRDLKDIKLFLFGAKVCKAQRSRALPLASTALYELFISQMENMV